MAKPKSKPKTKSKAKSKPKSKATKGKSALLAALAPLAPGVLDAQPGDQLTVAATVENAVVAYSVSYDGTVLLLQLVSGSKTIDVGILGTHSLRWAFNETPAADWRHGLTAQINSGPPVVLFSGSAANNDPPLIHDHAFVVVSKS